ncbi:hypothetical protein AC249_AIPGENE21798 [Exaiptasia diaphana]|nr:hypothetical protein AC249_AIPGENE21798 [Exaiptasia diaphana]
MATHDIKNSLLPILGRRTVCVVLNMAYGIILELSSLSKHALIVSSRLLVNPVALLKALIALYFFTILPATQLAARLFLTAFVCGPAELLASCLSSSAYTNCFFTIGGVVLGLIPALLKVAFALLLLCR